jgi:hypothetical protein
MRVLDRALLARCASVVLALGLTAGTASLVPAQTTATAPAPSATVNTGPRWDKLSPAQQQALAPLHRDWPTIDANRKAKWLEVASRFPTMPAEERVRIQERMAEWSRLSPAQRGDARIQFQQARQLPAAERQAKWDAYLALPEEERRALARQAKPNTKPPVAPALPDAKPTLATASAKRNVVLPSPAIAPQPVTPTVVQSRTGATTLLLSQPSPAPAHQQAGLPKIAATKDFVQPKTLLPKRGPQGAAVRPVPAASAPLPELAE